MWATNGIEIVPLGKLSARLWILISPMQQSLAQTRRSFPDHMRRKRHALDGFLRKVRCHRGNPAPQHYRAHNLKAFVVMLHCISRIKILRRAVKCASRPGACAIPA
jgi:hypothetical protein